MGTFPKEYSELEWGVCCVCVTFVYIYVGYLERPGLYPFWITDSTISRRWRRWLKTGGLHVVWMIIDDLDWAVHPRGGNQSVIVQTYLEIDMRGIRFLRFRPDPEQTCKWTVCLTLDFILCDWFLLNIYLFSGGEYILLLNALLWDVWA